MEEPIKPQEFDTDLAIYQRLSKLWKSADIYRDVRPNEIAFVPTTANLAHAGAAKFLSVLCYPESQDKRSQFVNAISSALLKDRTRLKSAQRKMLRKTPELSELLDMPNKRIDQTFNAALTQLRKRMRAAFVLLNKLASSDNPATQDPLVKHILAAAKQNTSSYPAFGSTATDEEDANEQITNSFRQRVMNPCKPVAHLALSFYIFFTLGESMKIDLLERIINAKDWLATVVERAEDFRVIFGEIFPQRNSKYITGRVHNFNVSSTEMIAVLPYIDQKDPSIGWDEIMKLYL